MNLADYPALAELKQPVSEICFERAIWGKVNGAASDFRWIARSQGFQGHHMGVEKALVISREERPRKCCFWRRSENCYYAVSCYPSQAKDRAGRSGFLEKQILECQAEGLPAAAAALTLLPLVTGFQDDFATRFTGDSRWEDASFVLVDLPSSRCSVTDERLLATIAKGRADLQQFRDADLELFFQQVESRNTPALLPAASPLTPEALAVLLLPFARERAAKMALGTWVPSARIDAAALRNWDGLACDLPLRPVQPPIITEDEPAASRRCVELVRDLHPSVRRLLDFADSSKRWLPAIPGDLAALLEKFQYATDTELNHLHRAFRRVQREWQRPSGLSAFLEDARRQQVRTKANLFRAAHLLLSPAPMEESLEPADLDELIRILQLWRPESTGKLTSRIDLQLAQLQNHGSRG